MYKFYYCMVKNVGVHNPEAGTLNSNSQRAHSSQELTFCKNIIVMFGWRAGAGMIISYR